MVKALLEWLKGKEGTDMATAATVSNYIISLLAPGRELETVKLHKLLYFCQGWCFALRQKQLFDENFEAWKLGPVVRDIYPEHARMVRIPPTFRFEDSEKLAVGNPAPNVGLDKEDEHLIRSVVRDYGSLNAFRLVDLTHLPGTPWSQVHQEDGDAQIIPKQMIQDYFLKEMDRVKATGELIPA